MQIMISIYTYASIHHNPISINQYIPCRFDNILHLICCSGILRLAIISDLHIGYERFSDDALLQARKALEAAHAHADAVLIPGDIFDNRTPKPEVIASAMRLFREFSGMDWAAKPAEAEGTGARAPIVVIPGTHERRAQDTENPVSLLSIAGFVVDASNRRATLEKDGEKVSIYGIAGVSEERFGEILSKLNPEPEPGAFNILMFHQSLYELLPFSDTFLRMEMLPKGFDLYVCGHIHGRVEKKLHGSDFLIPGSTVLTQLKEGEQEGKGFYIYDTSSRSFTFEYIDSRKFVLIKEDASNRSAGEVRKEIEEKVKSIAAASGSKPIIRVEITGKPKDGSINLQPKRIAEELKETAIVEIGSRIDAEEIGKDADAEELRSGKLKDISIKDYGMRLFLENLRKRGYALPIKPSDLFEVLSQEGSSRDKAISDAIALLYSSYPDASESQGGYP